MNANIKTQFRVYLEPKTGAQGRPHYESKIFSSREDAERHAQELKEDGHEKFWRITVR